MFDVFQVDPGFSLAEAVDFFQVPHYTNDHDHTTSEPYHFCFRQVRPEPDDPGNVYDVVVLWQDRDEPTDEEVCALILEDEDAAEFHRSIRGEDEDEEDEG